MTVQAGSAAGLHWTIKRGFVRYVARMEDGQIHGGHGVRLVDAATFVFPPAPVDEPDAMAFRGEVRLQAHGGALSLRIANPRIDLVGQRAVLSIDHQEGTGARLPLVTFVATGGPSGAGPAAWSGTDVRLTAEALGLFAGYYGEGEAFDDLVVVHGDE